MKPAKRLVVLVFLAAAGLLIASMVFTYRTGLIRIAAQQKMERQLLTLNQLDDFLSAVKDTETGERGFLLTGEESYLQPYTNVRAQVQTRLDGLHQLTLTSDLPQDRVQRVTVLTEQDLSELEQTIRLRRDKGLEAALTIVRDNQGKQVMDEIRGEIGRMRADEQDEFTKTSQRAQGADGIRTATFIGTAMLNLAFLGWAFGKMWREIRRREAAVLEAGRQKDLLSTTLASIGDGVIATDVQGRVTFLNSEAERLTGWKNSEAVSKPLAEIFRIVNEQTRQPAENPADRALRLGTVVGLANHTLLIAKDGREIPIDDSAAPIRQPGGPLSGVVLVFRDFTEHKRIMEALREAHEQLANHSIQLEKLVEERTAKLRDMVNELQHVSYAISHDMRAPLRAMSAFASILLEKMSSDGGSAEMRDYSRRIVVSAGRLDKLIQDALHYTKATLQEMTLEPVNLEKLVRGLLETYPNFQPDKTDIRVEGKLPVVLGNEALLTQCFSNLMGNAVKFVAPGIRPEVRLSAETNDGMTRIWVKDNGIGVSKHAQARLFQMFQRLTNDYEGSGIGLAIVRKLAERMGGKVGVESESGQGSRFWLEFRLANPRNELPSAGPVMG